MVLKLVLQLEFGWNKRKDSSSGSKEDFSSVCGGSDGCLCLAAPVYGHHQGEKDELLRCLFDSTAARKKDKIVLCS